MPEPRRSAPSGPETSWGGQITVDLPSCGAAAVTIATVNFPTSTGLLGQTISLLEPGDTVILTQPAAGLSVAVGILPGYCSAIGVAKIPLINPTSGALDPASAVFDYQIIKSAHIP